MSDKEFYQIAFNELEESKDQALWLKSIVGCSGDEQKAKLMYVKLRVEELTTETANGQFRIELPSLKTQSHDQQKSKDLIQYEKGISGYFGGSLCDSVGDRFCQIVKAKASTDVLCSIYVNEEAVVISPVAKNGSGSWALTGMILSGGSGAIGVLGLAAGKALWHAFHQTKAESVIELPAHLQDILMIDAKSIELTAYDYRSSWDFGGGEWETRIRLVGDAIFNGVKGTGGLIFAYEGKTYDRSFMAKANGKVPELAKLLGIPVPNIPKETKFIW